MLPDPGLDDWFTRGELCASHVILRDALNSAIGMVFADGNLDLQYSYGPFGNNISSSGNPSTTINAHKFIGAEQDPTGLYYLRGRYYNQHLARFLSPDPIGYAGGSINLYAYVNNDPMNLPVLALR